MPELFGIVPGFTTLHETSEYARFKVVAKSPTFGDGTYAYAETHSMGEYVKQLMREYTDCTHIQILKHGDW